MAPWVCVKPQETSLQSRHESLWRGLPSSLFAWWDTDLHWGDNGLGWSKIESMLSFSSSIKGPKAKHQGRKIHFNNKKLIPSNKIRRKQAEETFKNRVENTKTELSTNEEDTWSAGRDTGETQGNKHRTGNRSRQMLTNWQTETGARRLNTPGRENKWGAGETNQDNHQKNKDRDDTWHERGQKIKQEMTKLKKKNKQNPFELFVAQWSNVKNPFVSQSCCVRKQEWVVTRNDRKGSNKSRRLDDLGRAEKKMGHRPTVGWNGDKTWGQELGNARHGPVKRADGNKNNATRGGSV